VGHTHFLTRGRGRRGKGASGSHSLLTLQAIVKGTYQHTAATTAELQLFRCPGMVVSDPPLPRCSPTFRVRKNRKLRTQPINHRTGCWDRDRRGHRRRQVDSIGTKPASTDRKSMRSSTACSKAASRSSLDCPSSLLSSRATGRPFKPSSLGTWRKLMLQLAYHLVILGLQLTGALADPYSLGSQAARV